MRLTIGLRADHIVEQICGQRLLWTHSAKTCFLSWTNRQEIRTIEQFQSKAMDIYSPHSTNAGAGEAQTKADK